MRLEDRRISKECSDLRVSKIHHSPRSGSSFWWISDNSERNSGTRARPVNTTGGGGTDGIMS